MHFIIIVHGARSKCTSNNLGAIKESVRDFSTPYSRVKMKWLKQPSIGQERPN